MSTILVVDEITESQEKYQHLLVDLLGYELKVCANGTEALESFNSSPAQLVIFDPVCLDMDAADFCLNLRKSPGGIQIPIILTSTQEFEVMNLLEMGADDFLHKPIKEVFLMVTLKKFIDPLLFHKNDQKLVEDHTIFNDQYHIESLLGCGPYSVTFLAKDKVKDLTVALKFLNSRSNLPEISDYFYKVAGLIKSQEIPNLVKIYDFGEYQDRLFMISEFVSDGSLKSIMNKRLLSEFELVKVCLDLLPAIRAFNNNGIAHLDIRPANILRDDTKFKLSDFGIVIDISNENEIYKDIWRTPEYTAPELVKNQAGTSACDVYSLGVTLYHAAIGDNPFLREKPAISMHRHLNFSAPSVNEFDSIFSAKFANTVEAMMAKDPSERPSIDEIETTFTKLFEKLEENEKESSKDLSTQYFTHKELAEFEKKRAREEVEKEELAKLAEEKQKQLLRRRKITSTLSIIALVFMLIVSSIFFYKIWTSPPSIDIVKGDPSVVMCKDCGNIEEIEVSDIDTAECPKCQGSCGYAMICLKCKHKYPFVGSPMEAGTTQELLKRLNRQRQCPECGSFKTSKMANSEKQKFLKNIEDQRIAKEELEKKKKAEEEKKKSEKSTVRKPVESDNDSKINNIRNILEKNE